MILSQNSDFFSLVACSEEAILGFGSLASRNGVPSQVDSGTSQVDSTHTHTHTHTMLEQKAHLVDHILDPRESCE